MITWLQTTFGKHHKILLGTLLGITIISFVFFGAWSSASGGIRSARYLGVNLGSAKDLEPYSDAIRLGGNRDSQIPMRDWQEQIFRIHLADVLQIPNPTAAQLRDFIKKNFGEATAKQRLTQEIQRTSIILGINEQRATERYERYLGNMWRLQRAVEILTGPGHVLQTEAIMQWKQENTDWDIATATIENGTFTPTITPTDEQLQKSFDTDKEKYRLPPRQTLAYAIFPSDATKEILAPTDPELRKYARDHAGAIPDFDSQKFEESFAEKRAEITKLWTNEQLGMQTASEASAFLADNLPFEDAIPEFTKIQETLAKKSINPQQINEFDKDSVPENLPIPSEILRRGLDLSGQNWRSDAYTLGTNAIVLFHVKTTPSRLPEFTEIRDRLALDFAAQERNRLFNEHVITLGKQLKDAVASGKTFDTAAKELGLETKTYPTFKLTTLPAEFYSIGGSLLRALLETPAGAISPMQRIGNDAVYVQVINKKEPTIDATSPEIAKIQEALADRTASANFYGVPDLKLEGIYQELFERTQRQ